MSCRAGILERRIQNKIISYFDENSIENLRNLKIDFGLENFLYWRILKWPSIQIFKIKVEVPASNCPEYGGERRMRDEGNK